ncbi:hypothetical protein HRG_002702 [Hirsutella rhossiliensis]|uniref:Centromere protein Cenp-K n=1 Tax=Hirsutella rhossiliensis TaxID=111463 RepID=A0A9P8SLB1_9HYPO|nr:uncharacterized protein HRG_02702 [Hirsutella rhossiliensis]KAH0967293.1 hypothetical protein HRG_02702 [Hirsutella rhossiliensis]
MDANPRVSEADVYAANLDYTLKELQGKIDEHQAELQRIRAVTDEESPLPPEEQAVVIKSALDDLINSEPFLPSPGSLLPALLALRRTHQTIVESNGFLDSHSPDVERAKRQLEADHASLKDQQLLADALDVRVQSLRHQLDTQSDMPPEDGARKRIEELEAKVTNYDAQTARLMKSLLAFIQNHLAVMLAAEELGGPVVGSALDIDPQDLAAGFNAQGKPSKAKSGADSRVKRQRRIDELWGTGSAQAEAAADDEVAAAGREMQRLTEELLNALVEAKGDNSASYVRLTRESAAARFLVRSKVAQFHPKDATRLRLVDFGRELES